MKVKHKRRDCTGRGRLTQAAARPALAAPGTAARIRLSPTPLGRHDHRPRLHAPGSPADRGPARPGHGVRQPAGAQGLYFGQAAVARDASTRAHLLAAAQEETDHLGWCADRLRELDSRPSLFNPLWYAGSYAIGTLAGLRGDGWNLGFVVETERQVEAHLDEHLETLPAADQRSREILKVMKIDEARHADHAEHAGARLLPPPIPAVMALASRAMKAIAYRL